MPASCRNGTWPRRCRSPVRSRRICASGRGANSWPRCSATSPTRWSESLGGDARLRFTLNTLTRARFVAVDGTLEFATKDGAGAAPPGFQPWFDVPGRKTAGQPIAFGHWSSLGLIDRPDLLGLDTGCVWGGKLTAVRIDDGRREMFQVDCDAALAHG